VSCTTNWWSLTFGGGRVEEEELLRLARAKIARLRPKARRLGTVNERGEVVDIFHGELGREPCPARSAVIREFRPREPRLSE